MKSLTPMQKLVQRHEENLKQHPKAYFELATGRYFGCMLFLTDESLEQNPERIILAKEQDSSLTSFLLNVAGYDIDNIADPAAKLASIEDKDVAEFAELVDGLESGMSYAYMCIMHKGDLDWIIRIDTHHTVGHNQYFPLVRESAKTLPELITKAVASFKASPYTKGSILDIPEGTDTGVVCHFEEWEATAA